MMCTASKLASISYRFFVLYQPDRLIRGPVRYCNHDSPCRDWKVPRILHHVMLTADVPARWRQSYESCLNMYKNYTHVLWTADSSRQFLVQYYPWFLDAYDGYTYDMQRMDSIRYFLMYHFGGLYLDMDVICVEDIQKLASNMSGYNVFLPPAVPVGSGSHMIASAKRHPFFKFVIHRLSSANKWYVLPHITIILSAGPGFMTGCLADFNLFTHDIYIVNRNIFVKYFNHISTGAWNEWDEYIFKILLPISNLISFLVKTKFLLLSFFFSGIVYFLFIKSYIPLSRMKYKMMFV